MNVLRLSKAVSVHHTCYSSQKVEEELSYTGPRPVDLARAASAKTRSELASGVTQFTSSSLCMWTMWSMCMYSHVGMCMQVCIPCMDSGIRHRVFLNLMMWGWASHGTWSSLIFLDWLASGFQRSTCLHPQPHLMLRLHVHTTTLSVLQGCDIQLRPSFSNSKYVSRWATSLVPGIAFLIGIKSGSRSAPGCSLHLKPHGQIQLTQSQIEVSNDTRCSDTVGDNSSGFPSHC